MKESLEKITFYDWLMFERKNVNFMALLRKDILDDSNAPAKAISLIEWQNYLKSKNACDGAMLALEKAWAIYMHQILREPYRDY